MKMLALVFGDWVYVILSRIVRIVLRIRGVTVGENFYCEGIPKLIINHGGNASNIVIGQNVKILGSIELKVRENGKIKINDGCRIDRDCRLLAANEALLNIGNGTGIGPFDIFNCGTDVSIGQNCLIAGFVYIQSANHKIKRGEWIKHQGYTYGRITIGDDVWLGSHVTILPGVNIGDGAIVGSNAVVTKTIGTYEIVGGVPAKTIAYRSKY